VDDWRHYCDFGLYLDTRGSGSRDDSSKSSRGYVAGMAVFNSYTLTCFLLPWAVFGDCVLEPRISSIYMPKWLHAFVAATGT